MIHSGLLTLYRSLTRHRLYAFLNIGGLALGIAVFLVLFLFVQFERSYDRVLPGADKLWVIRTTWHLAGQPDAPYFDTMGGLLDQLRGDFPQVTGTRFWTKAPTVIRGSNATSEDMALVDSNFFDLFPFPAIAGDPKAALRDPTAIIITQKIAQKYFGSSTAIGQPLTLVSDGQSAVYHVGAVIEDRPYNMSFTTDIIAPLVQARMPKGAMQFFNHWGSSQLNTVLRFDDPAEPRALAAQMPAFIDRHSVTDQDANFHKSLSIDFLPLPKMHLSDPADAAIIATFGIVGVLTLFIAVVNYVNLATARAGLRAREVAVRKVLGGTRSSLIRQFIGEAIATVALSTLIGLALAEIALPFVNTAIGTTLSVHYLGAGSILPPLIALVLIVGLIAGAYPAFVLSRFRPAAVLASARAPGGGLAGARLRQALVVFQFAIAIAFAIGTGVLVAQTNHLRAADLGFQRAGIAIATSFMDDSLDVAQRRDLLSAFAALPRVTGVGTANDAPGDESTTNADTMRRPGQTGESPSITWVNSGPNYFKVYGARLLAGRVFDDAHGSDDRTGLSLEDRKRSPRGVVINLTAARKLGFQNAQDAIDKLIIASDVSLRVVGVIADMRFRSPHDAVRPVLYYYYREDTNWPPIAAVRFDNANSRQVLAAMESVWKRIAPTVPFAAKTVDQNLYDKYYKPDAQRIRLFTIGALLAVLIGCIGLYGLASFDTARRVKEIGIRKTLGASTRDILKLLIGQFMRPVLLANLIAWPLAFFAMRQWLSGFDDRIGLSPLFFVAASLAAAAIACLTIFGQAWRVAQAEPARALRYE